jgi:hypothetical protein
MIQFTWEKIAYTDEKTEFIEKLYASSRQLTMENKNISKVLDKSEIDSLVTLLCYDQELCQQIINIYIQLFRRRDLSNLDCWKELKSNIIDLVIISDAIEM